MLFDIRTIVGALLGCYGVIVLATGLLYSTDVQDAKTGGVDVNLWSGIAMIIAALIFFTWVRLRPVQVPPHPPETETPSE